MTATITTSARTLAKAAFAVLLAGTAFMLLPTLANAQDRAWLDQSLLAAAKKEGKVTAYGSMNEEEALPVFKVFTDVTGIPVEYVRNSDTGLMSRITVEQRAGKQSWDVLQTTAVNKLPTQWLAQFDPSEAKNLQASAKDPDRRWYGVYANYNSPAYNTEKVKKEELPQTLEDFAKKTEWKGRVAIDFSDNEWLRAVIQHYGEDKGKALVKEIVQKLDVKVVKGHLALARSVGAGEYWVALNNYTNLTLNVKLGGGPTDFWVIEPVAVFYGQIGVNAKSPNPNAARLLSNFMLSQEGQTQLTKFGRIPTRADVETNPPGVLKAFEGKKVVSAVMSSEEEDKWQKLFKELFAVR
jgi:iron(III) transport system substrate-binding protein